MEIYTGADLLKIPEMTLIDRFGRFGFDLFRKARGISNSPVRPNRAVNLLEVSEPTANFFIMKMTSRLS